MSLRSLPTAHPGGEGRSLGFQQRARALFLRLPRGAAAAAAGQDGALQPHAGTATEPPPNRGCPRILLPRVDQMLSGTSGEYLHWILGPNYCFSRRMIYSACGLAHSLFKISCWFGKCGKDICNPGMGVDFSQCLSESSHCAGS